MVTSWAALAEAMHLLGSKVGWTGQEALWEFIARGQLEIVEISSPSRERVRSLMAKYRDTPMALADATLVALAEERRWRRIFTLDDDFRVYRMAGRKRFEIVP
jgi:hypothetical protein